jgi:hypothetical protein
MNQGFINVSLDVALNVRLKFNKNVFYFCYNFAPVVLLREIRHAN